MESNDLKIFHKVVQLGSISHAAEQLGYVQSNVTLRIKALEEELAVPLFIRTNRGVQLLLSGELLFEYAEKILTLLAEASSVISNRETDLKIGATPSITTGYLASLMPSSPLNLSVYTRPPDELISLLIHGDLDGILLNRAVEHQELKSIFSYNETIAWLMASNSVSIQDTFKYPILVSRDKNCPYRKATLEYLDQNIITNYKLVEYDIVEPILAGIAVLLIRLKTEKMFCAADISSELKPVKIFLYVRTNKPKIAEKIEKFIQYAFPENHNREHKDRLEYASID